MKGCVFCKILDGEIPSHEVYRDENTYAFLDVNPVNEGHTLIIPERHAETVTDLEEDEATDLFRTVHCVAKAVDEALNPEGINLLQNNGEAAGQEVQHVHFHVIPRHRNDGLDVTWKPGDLDTETAETLVEDIKESL